MREVAPAGKQIEMGALRLVTSQREADCCSLKPQNARFNCKLRTMRRLEGA